MTEPIELVAPGAQVGRLAGAHMPGEAYWVARVPVALVGMAYPARVDWPALAGLGVRRVVCLVADRPAYDPAPLAVSGFALEDLFTRPGGPTDPLTETRAVGRAVDVVVRELRAGNGVAVHCRGGRGRTGTVIGAALVELGIEADVVVDWLVRLHRARGKPGWPECAWQEQVLRSARPPGDT